MPPRNPQRRQQILEALAQMLEDHPGDRITTARLAERVGVSEAAMYRHFPSKARMFDGLIEFIEDTLFQRVGLILQEVTTLVHGAGATRQAQNISRALFGGDIKDLAAEEIEMGFNEVPSFDMPGDEMPLLDLLVAAGIAQSKRQARQDISSGAVYLNGERCTDLERVVRRAEGLHGKYVIIRRGKNKYFLVR